ncbi:tetratricopeptide repeat protein [Niveispirillum sp. SYP-B3756]|uniref:tetratricopeptide repeat protein n=1 Tax=Niveispirillum sp. SYP-B3756 TaxID=2662178 RepID=UPI001291E00E|nr:tetratricopeptide repeat protein [Niveispirillum sp. SYP-B3756]MQP67535.1 tetratricopeptide repeat protein [Niveispirillum sp. SYP-B3756]
MAAGVKDLIAAAGRAEARGDGPGALALWEQVLTLDPDHAIALLALGDAARRAGDKGRAESLLRRALAASPALVPACCALANLLLHDGREVEAGTLLAKAAEMAPDTAYVWRDLGLFHRVTGDAEAALAAFERGLALAPDDKPSALGRALCLLRLGRWGEGFAAYHHRWSVSARPPRHLHIPSWQGEELAGKHILVWDEQGAGDTIMCARLIRQLEALGARVTFELPPALLPLFLDGRFGRPLARGKPLSAVDFQVALLDLPGRLGLLPESIPWDGAYLAADPAMAALWAARLPKRPGRLRIGFSWAGNPAHPGDRWRSPGLAAFAPLLQQQAVDWYALQVASGREELSAQPLPPHVTDLGGAVSTWMDSAAILSHLDLLITPDSGLAHLAGAMGRPVWTLIATDTDWRWLAGEGKTGWYPTMRLFRQARCGGWAGLLNRLFHALPA